VTLKSGRVTNNNGKLSIVRKTQKKKKLRFLSRNKRKQKKSEKGVEIKPKNYYFSLLQWKFMYENFSFNHHVFPDLSAACEQKQVELRKTTKQNLQSWQIAQKSQKRRCRASALTETKTWSPSVINPPYFIFLHEEKREVGIKVSLFMKAEKKLKEKEKENGLSQSARLTFIWHTKALFEGTWS
jgi:hypothetical protein